MGRKVRSKRNKYVIVIIKGPQGKITEYLAEHTSGTLAESKRAMMLNYGESASDVKIHIKYIKNLKDLLEPSKMDLSKLFNTLKKFRILKFENIRGKTKLTVEIRQ
jgi:hypothetical protein